ncbi:patatin-like phospholipase family protein [Tamlana fucoidanivorans]|uniref:Patatin n=1 Tax=Allotamlana fucoidanivorans TaxID=2583814 RepID=A0A5C4SMG1_9FLAO|nr:patatin-like phospholipase family protein [Tamlana fucoidanivorans]TNJ44563.1 patatin [Tamlana fucoidanivorans]
MKFKLIIIGLLLTLHTISAQQDKKPKVALVLSGGGAKGVAHIPVLQKLDSLGIVPDLVVGTSMGSVIGGLYAAGYSGDEIEKLTMQVDWDDILGGTVAMRSVGIQEKSEFNRYLVNLEVIDGKPKIKPALLKDQNLRELLTILLYPVYRVQDFDKLPIPFRSVTTDLVHGKQIVIKEGSLSLAIRASMSIPSIFEPVRYNGTLLVDGGVLNNFPTDVAKALGADIIIGSDVGGGMEPLENLNNITTILFQTSMMTSNIKNPANQKLCDVLIDHYPNLTYSTQDFIKSPEIYKEGLIESHKKLPELVALSQRLKTYKQRQHELPEVKDEFYFDAIEYHGISAQNMSLFQARMNIYPKTKYTSAELKAAVDKAMGTEIFNQITYHLKLSDHETVLVLKGYEKAKSQLSGTIHYDSNQGVGLVLNYTRRNVFGYSSRLLLGADIAEQPKFRIDYQQNVGKTKQWWWRTYAFGQKSKQRHYINGKLGEELSSNYFRSNIQLNKDLNPLFSYVGFDFNYEHNKIKPRTDPSINNNIYDLRRYASNTIELSFYFIKNSMNKVFFPTNGSALNMRLSRSFYNRVNVQFDENFEFNISGKTNNFTKFSLDYEKRLPLSNHLSFVVGLTSGLTFIDKLSDHQVSYAEYGQGAQYTLGGFLPQNRRDSYNFNGLGDYSLLVPQFLKVRTALQTNPLRNIYITPYLNLATVGFNQADSFLKEMVSPNINAKWIDTSETSFLVSVGSSFSYHSILGPVNFDFSYVNHKKGLPLFFNVGLNLNIQD